ncbi:MAG: hypothetical protein HYV63_04600, partial [Candidatus Schekmanbacteria bacterium]|nr:hypothetical protein [Candidatus Schekmanbacteria bacterium]
MSRRRSGPRDPGDGSLWRRLVSYPHLEAACRLARRGKHLQPAPAAFDLDREKELWALHEELSSQTYRPGPYRTFVVTDSKRRMISAAPFRDRVAHHALTSILEPIFEPKFIFDSYACRQGKGTHAAVRRFQHFARAFPYVLRGDIRKYFPSIDWEILLARLARH